MQLINPIWLWGLMGLLIPIGIHLLSRKEGKIIRFGSLRHLEESHTKQSINVRLNEVALLIMRCTLIFLIVILLCGLSSHLFQSQKKQWLVLESGLENDNEIVPLIDSLKQDGFEVKRMTDGFPDISEQQNEPFNTYWEMVDQLPVESLTKVIVVSYNLSSKFRGRRVALPENVTWISKEPMPKEFVLSRVKFSSDSVLIRRGKSSSIQTSFSNQKEPAGQLNTEDSLVSVRFPDTVRMTIYATRDFDYDRKIIAASLAAIENTVPLIFKITTSATIAQLQNTQSDWIIWLSKDAPDQSVLNTNSLVLREDGRGNLPLLMKGNSTDKQVWFITKRLNEEIALKDQFALNLSSLLSKSELTEARADSLNQTTQPEGSLWSMDNRTTSTSVRIADDSAEQLLLIAIMLVLLAERFVAYQRNA